MHNTQIVTFNAKRRILTYKNSEKLMVGYCKSWGSKEQNEKLTSVAPFQLEPTEVAMFLHNYKYFKWL